MTNTNELTAKLKAAAQLSKELGGIANYSKGKAAKAEFEKLSNEDNILSLTEALEAAEKDAKQWKEVVAAFCADDADWHKLTTSNNELISQLSIALCKQADRIASLEARTLTVKLPPEVQFSNVPFAADGANAMRKEVIKSLTEACAAAGIKLQIEGE
ncbi:hypothetical protein [Escherichia coli]|uniref:hypothetical protein n=1 Tax=Escherichia coli TaxID=562 RepID=UPI001365FB5B|nr:hypothetical protein [Escherichia coli]MWF13630.1 hypothetical protein [Escherichia coli]